MLSTPPPPPDSGEDIEVILERDMSGLWLDAEAADAPVTGEVQQQQQQEAQDVVMQAIQCSETLYYDIRESKGSVFIYSQAAPVYLVRDGEGVLAAMSPVEGICVSVGDGVQWRGGGSFGNGRCVPHPTTANTHKQNK